MSVRGIAASVAAGTMLFCTLAQAEDIVGIRISAGKAITADALKDSWVQDYNQDGKIEIVAFGDSITRGVGDFVAPGEDVPVAPSVHGAAGYPMRIESYFALTVDNEGVPGESISGDGVSRFASIIPELRPDIVLIAEGANDGFSFLTAGGYFHDLQTLINIARVVGAQPVLSSILPPCCDHSGLLPYVTTYNEQIRQLAVINAAPMADIWRAWTTTCSDVSDCNLLNRPDGLHPNTLGYDVMAETFMAAMLKIDLFAADGAQKLEAALSLPAGTVKTKPDTSAGGKSFEECGRVDAAAEPTCPSGRSS